jgi:hypothetical protein
MVESIAFSLDNMSSATWYLLVYNRQPTFQVSHARQERPRKRDQEERGTVQQKERLHADPIGQGTQESQPQRAHALKEAVPHGKDPPLHLGRNRALQDRPKRSEKHRGREPARERGDEKKPIGVPRHHPARQVDRSYYGQPDQHSPYPPLEPAQVLIKSPPTTLPT